MNDNVYNALLAKATLDSTPEHERTASMGRILASDAGRARLRDQLASNGGACSTCDHNRSELQRAIGAVEAARAEAEGARQLYEERDRELQRLREDLRAILDRGANTAGRPEPEPEPQPQRQTRQARSTGYRRRPRPIETLEDEATCHDCGASLAPGDRVRIYSGGRVYGVDCHGRRAAS